MARIRILGSGREVGRAAILVESGGRGLLLDYGVNFDENDRPVFPGDVRPRDLDGLVLTHSHLDHIGAAPYLYVSQGPKVFGTRVTLHVSRLLLYDMIKLNGAYLPYDERSVEDMLGTAEYIDYGREYEAGRFAFKTFYSGHIPGSTAVLVEVDGRRILYTSDVNVIETKLVGPARLEGAKADVVIVESTYGDSDHPPRSVSEERFYNAVMDVVSQGGTVLVPAFSVSRGQEIAMILAERGFEYPVWLDGMIRQVAEIYAANPRFILNPGLLMKVMSEFRIVSGWQDRRRAFKKPGVIIASAGMLKGGPSLYYARKMATNKKNGIFMVSYQAPGTPGRMILEEGVFGEERIPVLARVEWFDFSSHIDQSGIIKLLRSVNGVEKVVLVHGDPKAQEALKTRIREELGIREVETPGNMDVLEV
ncbi:putative exonuclease [Aeropyrum pernix K1]|uniref:Exonuclease n=1 Tax=Aeropyrum pernix (strain ATCC 700893 / DSM 11879 / JCM 9820 / NBRC 100138 / K1) TaxID=272557 RepID=Q9YFR8_AERPE|nr:MBL fold metallo-hydrolase [Aeropyrum pernix]BAA79093.1 putative exonuclease [Aeropyrum pernix K1]